MSLKLYQDSTMLYLRSVFFAISLVILTLCLNHIVEAEQELSLRANLARARPGDYLVTAQNKNYTVLLIRARDADYVNIEEITVPSNKVPSQIFSWREWIQKGAPGNTCWMIHTIYLSGASHPQAFSVTRNEWVTIPQSQNFLSTLLNLNFASIAPKDRKRIGPPPSNDLPDGRPLWQPKLVVDGKVLADVAFDGWRTRWPKDGSELSGKMIEVYLPRENQRYPSYFPYWLQVSGVIGKAKVRIVDSGSSVISPARIPTPL